MAIAAEYVSLMAAACDKVINVLCKASRHWVCVHHESAATLLALCYITAPVSCNKTRWSLTVPLYSTLLCIALHALWAQHTVVQHLFRTWLGKRRDVAADQHNLNSRRQHSTNAV
eukprot:3353-Heterococcus_DN1.PRE.13